MRIVKKVIEKVYLFNCPVCGTRLEAAPYELVDIGNKISRFICPECNADRYISWRNLRKKIIYENGDER